MAGAISSGTAVDAGLGVGGWPAGADRRTVGAWATAAGQAGGMEGGHEWRAGVLGVQAAGSCIRADAHARGSRGEVGTCVRVVGACISARGPRQEDGGSRHQSRGVGQACECWVQASEREGGQAGGR